MNHLLKGIPNSQRLGDYPLGSIESRAAARAEIEHRARAEDENAVVVVMTGIPNFFLDPGQLPVIEPPDSLHRYQMLDGSIVEVIRRHWGEPNRHGVTIYIDQTWPDGEVYRGESLVKSLEDVQRLGLLMSE